jgi:uncharacterized protein (TIGR02996 family)
MTDEGFLRALQEKPNDDTTRLIYADWLEDQEEPSRTRAAFIRLDCELASREKQARRLFKPHRRRKLAAKLEPHWLAVVSKAPIERCTFAFECPLKWENLQSVEGSTTTRYCDSCKKHVHYCATIAEARQHAKQGHCVAVDARHVRRGGDLDPPQPDTAVVGLLA